VILDIIHDLDVVDQMQKNNVKHRTDWYWHKQLRYYMEDKCCMVPLHPKPRTPESKPQTLNPKPPTSNPEL
jgi:hypothetical protein